MIIKELRVKNYRSIKDATLTLGKLTALVGRNGAGKSNFLSALNLFWDRSSKPDDADHHGGKLDEDMEIGLTFVDMTPNDLETFAPYVHNDEMHVVRLFGRVHQGSYHGERMRHREFDKVRKESRWKDKRENYKQLRESCGYKLPNANSADAVETALKTWEDDHPADCKLARDDDQFFGATNVGWGYLIARFKFLPVGAVRDAQEDAIDRTKSTIGQIVDLVVRAGLEEVSEWSDLQKETKTKYERVVNGFTGTAVPELEKGLTNKLEEFAPGNKVSLSLSGAEALKIPLPTAQVELTEDDYTTSVGRSGHGLQRAFIFAALQMLTEITKSHQSESKVEQSTQETQADSGPTLLLAIEEPELYQHPARQRRIADTLRKMAEEASGGPIGSVQIVYTTHSPQLVSLDRCDDVRLIKKVAHSDSRVMSSETHSADVTNVARRLQKAHRSKASFTADSLRPRLAAVTNPWINEGFFTRVVVLVEGETDRSAIRATASSIGHNFDGLDIAVIPCDGKPSLDRPLAVFQELGIPCYLVWDGDEGKRSSEAKTKTNASLMSLVNMQPEAFPCFVNDVAACFSDKLESTLKAEWGCDVFQSAFGKAREKLGLEAPSKNQLVYEKAIKYAQAEGAYSETLRSIVEAIVALRGDDMKPQSKQSQDPS